MRLGILRGPALTLQRAAGCEWAIQRTNKPGKSSGVKVRVEPSVTEVPAFGRVVWPVWEPIQLGICMSRMPQGHCPAYRALCG